MRPFIIRAARGVLVPLLLAACKSGSSALAPAETPRPSPALTVPAPRGPVLGIGEARKPQPFTLEQRLLDAVSRGDRKTIERTLEHGTTLRARDDIGRSVVVLAVLDAGDLELVKWLHAQGATLDEPDNGGRTALSFAAANGQLEIVRYLADNGADVNRRDVQQRTPLFHAALGDHRDSVAFLLDRGGDVNARDQFGDTPLIVACAKGYGGTAALLLRRGADATLKDQEGRTARERAAAGTAACLGPATPSR